MPTEISSLLQKIEAKSARVVVIGIGHVGLPLVAEFADAGFRTTGLDVDRDKVRSVNAGESYVPDVPTAALAPHVQSQRLDATTDARVLRGADAVIVCVPTPLDEQKGPDPRCIVAATEDIARHQHDGMMVILESTSYPGATSELLVPRLTANGAVLGQTVFIAFSPERVDPGNSVYKTKNTPKVVGGACPASSTVATALYSQIIDEVVPVSSTETAEMVKLLENTFRAVNIGLVNEIAMMSRKLGVDPFEVVRAAATKPFGFMPFYPGPGLGGHCIAVDPHFLSWKFRALQSRARMIEVADSINSGMPAHVVKRTVEALQCGPSPLPGASVLVYGVSYKKDVRDCRESPAFPIIDGLRAHGAHVRFMDPFFPSLEREAVLEQGVALDSDFGSFDAVVVVTDHTALDRTRLLREATIIVDTRDALRGLRGDRSKVFGL